MTQRLTVANIIEGLKRRDNRGAHWIELNVLKDGWEKGDKPDHFFEQFIPVRLASYLEATVRHALHELVSGGEAYLDAGIELLSKRNIKDIANALRPIQQDQLTVADLVAQTQSVSSVEQMLSA